MNAPKHNIKTFGPTIEKGKVNLVVIPHRFWIGSALKDKNGREFFEGDKVTCSLFDEPLFTVKRARDGAFVIVAQDGNCYPLFNYASELEVVGHVAED